LIVNRYLIREVLRPLTALCGVLIIVFVSYSTARYLTMAADGIVAVDLVLTFVFLKTLIALEVLLPISLYLSVVMGLGRLYADYEMTALNATGFSELQVAQAILRLAVLVAAVVACLSLYGRPWAYQETYRLEALAEAKFDLNELKAGRFYEGALGGRTFFVERVNRRRGRMEQVFIKSELARRVRIIVADEAFQTSVGTASAPILKFLRGYVYEFDRHGNNDQILKFGEMTLLVDAETVDPIGYKRKAAPTLELARSDNHKDMAEFQWRLTTPVSTVLLALLGIPISRTSPRQGKYAKMLVAILIFAIYYNLTAVAEAWVEDEIVSPIFPGVWWTEVLLAVLLLLLLQQPVWSLWLRQRLRRMKNPQ
jgi:lipopolysaccharide export system permease protein